MVVRNSSFSIAFLLSVSWILPLSFLGEIVGISAKHAVEGAGNLCQSQQKLEVKNSARGSR